MPALVWPLQSDEPGTLAGEDLRRIPAQADAFDRADQLPGMLDVLSLIEQIHER